MSAAPRQELPDPFRRDLRHHAVSRHLDVADKTVRRALDKRAVVVRPRGRIAAGALAP
ncbi:MAG: hypothetical protein ACLQB1_00700 [Streptosporangiaceae bacterium]